jgi:polysaccharide pyruvyl transferase WcaK-like protein
VTLVGGDDVDLGFARSLEGLPPHVTVVEARTPEELVALTGRAVVTVATRYHSVIMSLLAGTPVVSIGYGEKHRAVLLQLGLEDTHRDVETFDPVEVVAMVEDQARRHDEIRARISSGVADARERLDAQWPAVEDVLLARRTRRTVAA